MTLEFMFGRKAQEYWKEICYCSEVCHLKCFEWLSKYPNLNLLPLSDEIQRYCRTIVSRDVTIPRPYGAPILDNGCEYMKYMSKDHFEEVMTGEVTQQLKCTK